MNNLTPAPSVAEKTPLQIRYGLWQLEQAMRQAFEGETPQLQEVEPPVLHHFTEDGRYIRTIFLKAGVTIVGKLHRHAHPFTMWQGRITVVSEDKGVKELSGFNRGISEPAIKRAAYVHEDTIWSEEHPVGEIRDLEVIERLVIAESYTELGLEDPAEQTKQVKE